MDRHSFRSLDFREPSGVLFEIDADEDRAMPGEKTILPPRFEGRRAQILAGLKPIASVTPSCPWRKR